MDFALTEEQIALQETVRDMLGREYGSSEKRRAVLREAPGFSRKLWSQLAELGALALPFPEELGGVGAGPVEVAIVSEEIGRVLAPEPFVDTVVIAGELIRRVAGAEQQEQLIGSIAAGESITIFAHAELSRSDDAPRVGVTAEQRGDGWALQGIKEPIIHGGSADLLIVSAATAEGTGLFLVDPESSGVERREYPTPEGGRAATLLLAEVPAVPLGDPRADQTAAISAALDAGRWARAHEAVGAMDESVSLTTSYLTTRKQFGVTLNNFQALTHRAADLYVALELARSTVLWATAVREAAQEQPELSTNIPTAQAWLQVARAARLIGPESIQLHGGIGMTAEYSIGHYASRLIVLEQLAGTADQQRARLRGRLRAHGVLEPAAHSWL